MNRRVVITGVGAVTPIGNNAEDFFDNLIKGVNGIDFITKFDTTDSKAKLAAELKGFQPEKVLNPKELKRLDDFSVYALCAADEAVKDSGLDLDSIDRNKFGVIVSSGIGGMTTIESQIIKMHEQGEKRISPLFIPTIISNMVSGNVAVRFGANGICTSIVTACASGTNSIGEAYRNIKHGYSDIILAGGSEATIARSAVAGFSNLTALSTSVDKDRASLPFDKERSGFVMGEGAGVVVLEDMESAVKRGAKIYAEVVGYGTTCDAYHMTSPNPNGVITARAVTLSLEENGIKPEDVQYINAHGTATKINDQAETLCIKNAFGDHAKNLKISSTKSMTGHLLGAAGAIEAIATIKAIDNGIIPPTINLKVPDEECDLDYTPNKAVKLDITHALSTSFGFGGHNAVLCFKKWEGK